MSAADRMRRAMDVVVASALLVVATPVMAAIAVVVRATSRGPVFFVQERVGRDGRLFGLMKFRTMVADAPARGGALTTPGDPRITRAGAVLRRWKLDELPQLVNVWRGDMSFVGPRPEVPRYVARYSDDDRKVLAVRPGITDPASIRLRDEEQLLGRFADRERAYVEVLLPLKIDLQRDYIANQSFVGDVALILRTLARL
jgi:lipopolysaccharide/colanic/teichoic acid biosynthesis glycosyltransferase